MTQTQTHFNSVAPLRNVAALVELIDRVKNREFGLPGMACFYGPSGFGKTTAAIYATNKFDAYQIQVKENWTLKHFLQKLVAELGFEAKGTIADLADRVSNELAVSGRPLIVDDAQYLVHRKALGILRDIYESSFSPVIIIGEEKLPSQIAKWENIHGRILSWVPAEPATLDDLKHLQPIYCPGVEIADELARKAVSESRYSIRRISLNLARIKELAKTRGLSEVTLKDWGDRRFVEVAAPAARDFVEEAKTARGQS